MNSNSQANQDIFVLSLIEKGFFIDIGCEGPEFINNTFLLEQNGWIGISVDIVDFSKDWKSRKTPFICRDATKIDYQKLFDDYEVPDRVEYLNLDIEGNGDRFKTLEMIMKTDRSFGIITIEHDSYRGYYDSECIPQRNLLRSLGYELVCEDVKLAGNPFEDWWINPSMIDRSVYSHLFCKNEEAFEIKKKIKI